MQPQATHPPREAERCDGYAGCGLGDRVLREGHTSDSLFRIRIGCLTCPYTHTSTSKTAHNPDYALNAFRCRSHTLHSRSIIPFNNRRTARRSTNQRSTSGGVRSPLQPSDGSWMSCAVPPSVIGLWRANHGRSDTMAVSQDALTSCLHMSHTRHSIYHVSSYHTHHRHVII